MDVASNEGHTAPVSIVGALGEPGTSPAYHVSLTRSCDVHVTTSACQSCVGVGESSGLVPLSIHALSAAPRGVLENFRIRPMKNLPRMPPQPGVAQVSPPRKNQTKEKRTKLGSRTPLGPPSVHVESAPPDSEVQKQRSVHPEAGRINGAAAG